MTTATLTKQSRKSQIPEPPFHDGPVDFCPPTFFMPAPMSLEQFRQWTYADDFPKTGVIAYIGKEIFIDMSPERLRSHGSVKTEVCTVVNALVRKKKSGKFYGDRTRLVNVSAEISNEPDGLFAKWASFKNGKIRPVPTKKKDDYIELEGTPDWILEVVSPGSVGKDKRTLKKRYHRAGIGEYWLIDARGEEVDFQILIHSDDGYLQAKRDGEWQVSKVFGKKFRLRRIKDELGDVDYRLDVK
jgi:Uma2 family endonuclease